MKLKQALERIAELERKVKELEARPQQVIHYHYETIPYIAPAPQPWQPWIVTCSSGGTLAGTSSLSEVIS